MPLKIMNKATIKNICAFTRELEKQMIHTYEEETLYLFLRLATRLQEVINISYLELSTLSIP